MFWSVYVRMELLRVGLDERRLFEMCVLVQVAEANPVVERNSTCTE